MESYIIELTSEENGKARVDIQRARFICDIEAQASFKQLIKTLPHYITRAKLINKGGLIIAEYNKESEV